MSVPLEIAVMYDTDSVDHDGNTTHRKLKTAEDAALADLARNGDYAAFEELVRRYRNDVFGLSYHYIRNREDAWDISQEVFIKAHRAMGSFRGDASFKTWILRITANRCKDYFKKRRLQTVALDEGIATQAPAEARNHPGERMEQQELGRAIEKAVDALPEKHKAAFILREFEGLSYEQMAGVLGCSMGTVMSRLHHARKKLQKALIAMGVVEEV